MTKRPTYLADEVPKMAAELVALRSRVEVLERDRDAALSRVAALTRLLQRLGGVWDRATMENNSREIAKAMGHDYYRQMFDVYGEAQKALAEPPKEEP